MRDQKTIMLIPTDPGVGLPTAVRGLTHALSMQGILAKPLFPFKQEIASPHDPGLSFEEVQALYNAQKIDTLIDTIIRHHNEEKGEHNVIVICGLLVSRYFPFADTLNKKIAQELDASLVFVTRPTQVSEDNLKRKIDTLLYDYKAVDPSHFLGIIVNKIGAPRLTQERNSLYLEDGVLGEKSLEIQSIPSSIQGIPVIGKIPWKQDLIALRMKDLAHYLPFNLINAGDLETRRVQHISLCARNVENMVGAIKPGHLLIAAGDRVDIIIACCLAELQGIQIAGLILTGGYEIPDDVQRLCQTAFDSGLPVFSINSDSYTTCLHLEHFNLQTVPSDDTDRIELASAFAADHIDINWIQSLSSRTFEKHLTPAAFRYFLKTKAEKAKKHILLPEGHDPRVVHAANIAADKNIAKVTLLGNPTRIHSIAESLNIDLSSKVSILDPEVIREKYVKDLIKLRAHRGVTEEMALEYLEKNHILGTMMLQKKEVDGLVAGALTASADVLRPALQLIKTKPSASLVSSIFFMCLPKQILVYGDCAVNTNPDANALADIAIQSNDSAKLFGIDPIVAMISYSTLSSGKGKDVEKVADAINIVREKRPDILIDGPLQYDAAFAAAVAEKKASGSKVAGKATVFIFPDLNTGNTTYKAVQQSAEIYAFGPMLQGLNQPVNDLSRGAFVEDIVYTIAITAIQATLK